MTNNFKQKKVIKVYAMLLASLIVLLFAPFLGLDLITISSICHDEQAALIFWNIRIPRVILSFLVGAALALGGMNFQAVFRNSLATPYTLGVASGASFGAVLYILCKKSFSFLGVSGISLFSFGGAAVAMLAVYFLAHVKEKFTTSKMLLAGVAISFFFSSWILIILFFSDFVDSYQILHWLMGSMNTVGYIDVLQIAPFVLMGIVASYILRHDLNVISLGEDVAYSLGVDVQKTKWILFIIVSLMIGGVVSVCGPIGFVGIMVPHICRILVGAEHSYLMPATFLFGGLFLTVCDLVSRIILPPIEIPIGIITAFLGGPFFLFLLLRD